jgi:pentatricopeptide repeat protein
MEIGLRMHERISRSGLLKQDITLGNALVDMYAKCGELTRAQDVLLQELPVRDVVAWNTLIGAYTQQGRCAQALDCFEHMQAEGILPDEVTFLCILKACSAEKGMQIHDQILYKGLLEKDVRLGNALMDMYLRCGMPSKALEVLDALPLRDAASFNTLISGLSQQGKPHEAMDFYERMSNEGLRPDIVTFVCVLKICGSTRAIAKGKQIHEEIENDRHLLLEGDIALGNALVDMYAKCGMLAKAKQVLEGLPDRDIVSWSIVLAAYVESGQGVEALALFEQMESEGFSSDAVTFIHMFEACGSAGALGKGEQIHVKMASKGLLARDGVLGTALVSMYARCGALEKAKQALQELNLLCDVVSWNALIAAYAQQGRCEEALGCYEEMQSSGLSPNAATFASTLKACGGAGAVDKGERIHGEIVDRGLFGSSDALGNALIDMYAKCGMLGKAQQMLEDEAPIIADDVASWNALIVEHARRERYNEALDCYERMCSGERRSLCPDVITYVGILKACGNAGAIDKGEAVCDEIRKRGLLAGNLVLGNAIIDMYCKCGAMAMAEELLEQLHVRDTASWNAVISGYAQRSRGQEALNRFEEMGIEGLYPDDATFLCVLSACSHSGLVNEAWILFCSMNRGDAIVPKLEHHSCMLVLLGYSGHFAKAMSLIKEMGSSDHPILWLGILGACRKWGNVKLARLAFEEILKLDGACAEAYVIMADIYAVAGMPESAEKLLSCGSE